MYGEARVAETHALDALRTGIDSGRYKFDPTDKLSPPDLQSVQAGFGEKGDVPLKERDVPKGVYDYAKRRGII